MVWEAVRDFVYGGVVFASVCVCVQTGSGKTYTMMGAPGDLGITPRVVNAIFQSIEDSPDTMEFTLRVSYLEIYMEVRAC